MMTEVFIRKQKIRPGKTERLRKWIKEMTQEVQEDGQGVRDIWSKESLHTISLFIEHTEDGDYFVWYLEADSMKQLIQARQTSEHPLHDVEDEMMEEVLEDPEEAGNFEPLLHGVSSERSNNFQVQQYTD
jgi:hypothetical protein